MKTNGTAVRNEQTFDAIVETLVAEGRIELRNFGVFEVKKRAPRKARNPRTGEAIPIEARRVVTFHASHKLKEQIQGDQL